MGKTSYPLNLLFQRGSKTLKPEQSSLEFELRWSSLTLPFGEWRSGEELLQSSRTMLEQFSPQKILLLSEMQS
jgi:hypothetical protein